MTPHPPALDTHSVPRRRRAPLEVPLAGLWPDATRTAELGRGSLVRCGPGVRPVGWPENPRVRLAALAPWLRPGHVAVLLTAAWVWGASRTPGVPLHSATPDRSRAAPHDTRAMRVHQFLVPQGELVAFGPYAVTSRARTLTDILRLSEEFLPAHRIACRLLRISGFPEESPGAAESGEVPDAPGAPDAPDAPDERGAPHTPARTATQALLREPAPHRVRALARLAAI